MKKYFLVLLSSVLFLLLFNSCSDESKPEEVPERYYFKINFDKVVIINDGDKGDDSGECYFEIDVVDKNKTSLIGGAFKNEKAYKANDGDTVLIGVNTEYFKLPNIKGEYFEVTVIGEENDGSHGKEYFGNKDGYKLKFEYPWNGIPSDSKEFKIRLGTEKDIPSGVLIFNVEKIDSVDLVS